MWPFILQLKCWRDPTQSELTGSTVSTTCSPVTSHQIWFVWRYSWCFIYFSPLRLPAASLWVSWFIHLEQIQKKRHPLTVLVPAGINSMKFNEFKFSTTSTGVGHLILKCFIRTVVVACGISSFETWRASFISLRQTTKGHSLCRTQE